jgi:hypothetical protein
MRYILAALISVCAFFAQAQQINPVPDYVFGNRMSVGRTSVTDTAAYFSVGPRYGAIRGMMPPMVTDTALVTSNKRNGLLIFSIQKNKYLYWDSAGTKWAEMASSGGTAITPSDTASMLLPYLRKVDTTLMLSNYFRKSDTVWLSNRINLKLNLSDTASMLTPYYRESNATAALALKLNISDTANMLSNYTRQSISGVVNYLPKYSTNNSFGNSAIYDSSGFLRLYKNNIGNVQGFTTQNSIASLNLEKDGYFGYPLKIQQNDSVANSFQLAFLLRKGLLTTDNVRPGYGVGLEMQLQDNTKAWQRSGWIVNRIVDSSSSTFKSEMVTMVRNGAAYVYPLTIRHDSTIRILKLAGVGSRIVTADANGDLSATTTSFSVDTTVLSTRSWRQKGDDSLGLIVSSKLNISDTSSMLTPYLRKSDTTNMLSPYAKTASVNASLATKLNISDTSSMLSPYYKSANATSSLALKLNISDTATMLSPYYKSANATSALATKVNVSDTSTMLGNYVRHAGLGLLKSGQSFSVDTASMATRLRVQKAVDSLNTLISAKGNGTVTSIITGTGLTGGTITTSGTISADTAILSTRAWRKKGDDSLALTITGKLNVSDTASMLTPYLRKSDTTSMLSPYARTATVNASIATKLNISDTSSMLSPYYRSASATAALATKLNIADTASMLSLYYRSANATAALAAKLNISDTATMMAPYVKESDTVWLSNRINLKVSISDTATMLSPYLKESDTAFLSNRINFKLNISDTSSMLTNYVRHAGNGLTKSGQGLLVDTAAIATRARVQKGIDSIANIAASGITGSGTANYLSKFNATNTLGNSQFQDNGTIAGVGATATNIKFRIYETAASNNQLLLSNAGTYHTGIIASSSATPLADTKAWGIFGGQNAFITGTADAVGFVISSDVPFFQIQKNTNLNSGSPSVILRAKSDGEVLVNTVTDAGAYPLQIGGSIYATNMLATALAGTGTRMVVADASGLLSTQAIPSGGGSSVTFDRKTASYTLVAGDVGKTIEMNLTTANNLTVPTNASATIAVGSTITITQYGTGRTTIVAASGVTIRSANGWLKLAAQYGAVTLVKVGTDEWYAFGALSA